MTPFVYSSLGMCDNVEDCNRSLPFHIYIVLFQENMENF